MSTTPETPLAPQAPPAFFQSLAAKRPSYKERLAAGKELRSELPRAAHAEYTPPRDRDPIAILEAQAKTRLSQLVPIRHARMLASPFAFLRGAAAVMMGDIATAPDSTSRPAATCTCPTSGSSLPRSGI